jgi:alpha-glucuronidase
MISEIHKLLSFTLLFIFIPLFPVQSIYAEDGYRMWLRYDLISDQERLEEYRSLLQYVVSEGVSPTIEAANKEL